jgi:hypothetical protein
MFYNCGRERMQCACFLTWPFSTYCAVDVVESAYCVKGSKVCLGYNRALVTVRHHPPVPQCSCRHCPATSCQTSHFTRNSENRTDNSRHWSQDGDCVINAPYLQVFSSVEQGFSETVAALQEDVLNLKIAKESQSEADIEDVWGGSPDENPCHIESNSASSHRIATVLTKLQLSRYSDCLRAGRRRGRSSSPGRVKNFHFSTSSRPALGPTQSPIQWVLEALSRGKAAGAWSWPLSSN